MTTQLQRAYENITIPVGLEQRVLAACLGAKRSSPTHYWMPAASMAACGAVLLVSLAATGSLDRWLIPQEELHIHPGGDTPLVTMTPGATATTGGANQTTVVKGQSTTALGNKTTVTATRITATESVGAPTVSGEVDYCKRKLWPGDEVTMSLPQLEDYFGRRIQPAWLPEDMEMLQTSYGYSVYYRNEEKMKDLTDFERQQFEKGILKDDSVIYDQNVIHYGGQNDRSLSVAMSTAPYPRNLLGDITRFDEAITVAGVAAMLAYYDDSTWGGQAGYSYTVLFTVDGVEFKVNAWNLPRSEFLRVVESIIE